MEQKLLHKMFSGQATDDELTQIRQWVNECKENRDSFYHERAFFDALQFNDVNIDVRVRKRSVTFWKWAGSVAAAVIALLLFFNVPTHFENNSPREIAFNTIKVPAGQRVEVTLADGTHLWLNARSEFSYPVSFNGDKREVHLKGEAFFDVARDENKKFIVNTGRCEVEVLGTQFNVDAYGEDDFSTALLRGSVKVTDKSQSNESVVLEPNNAVRLDNGKLTVTPITDFSPYSWKDGVIAFKDINFEVLMKKLEKNYGIRITVENSGLDNYACSGKFRISDGIEEVLRALQQDARFTFEWDSGEEIRIQ
ncbi:MULTISPECIES: FecR domain-containing protein [Parabacteroides]|uniref:FecR family protein n=1 Tax=Parabacteroides leei TaxID=2939491 RepID=UPI00189B119E|nr:MULTISPECIES: FecR domain-containing protein [Parabacteroides]MCL3850621.1 FecR domain-containing protein [Parabacteroides leei]